MSNIRINYQFKILSTIGIILVICGHYGANVLTIGNLFRYDTFHMPLFIFISGYFYKDTNHISTINVIKYVKKKILHLMVPYWIWNCIYGMIALALDHNTFYSFSISKGISFSMDTLFIKPFQLGNGFIYNVAAWFVGSLFLVEICNCTVKYFFTKFKMHSEIYYGIFFFLTGYSAIKLAQHPWENPWKIVITRTLYLLLWYEFGVIYHKYLEKIDVKINLLLKELIIIVISAIFIIFLGENKIPVIYNSYYPNGAMITIIRALLGILFWLNISKALVPIMKDNAVMLFIGNHTFSLMMHHGIVGFSINCVIFLLHKLWNLFPGFDSNFFKKEIWYSYTLNNMTETHILYVILIISIILYVVWLYEKHITPHVKKFIQI